MIEKNIMITREDLMKIALDENFISAAVIDKITQLITAEQEQYQSLVEAAVLLDDEVLQTENGRRFRKAVKPFIKPSPSERLEALADDKNSRMLWDEHVRQLREIAAAVREMEK